MNDSLTRKFCESRYRWPIIATATTLIGVSGVWPQADDYFDNRNSRNDLATELAEAQQAAAALPQCEIRAAEAAQALQALESRTVDDEQLAKFRDRIVELVRDSGCQIRQLDVSAPAARAWQRRDNPLQEVTAAAARADATPFVLERRTMNMVVDGPMTAIHELIERLEKEHTLAHPHRVHFQGATSSRDAVTLEMELWLFALSRGTT